MLDRFFLGDSAGESFTAAQVCGVGFMVLLAVEILCERVVTDSGFHNHLAQYPINANPAKIAKNINPNPNACANSESYHLLSPFIKKIPLTLPPSKTFQGYR